MAYFEEKTEANTHQIWSIGSNEYYQQLDGTKANVYEFKAVQNIHNKRIKDIITLRDGATFILYVDGSVDVGGCNKYGQLAAGHKDPISRAHSLNHSFGIKWISSGINACHVFVMNENNELFAAGDNGENQCGIPESSSAITKLLAVPAIKASITAIACGGYFSLFLSSDGSLVSCGYGDRGQLGHGRKTRKISTPTTIKTTTAMKQIAAGYSHCLSLSTDNKAFGWGDNDDGRCGHAANMKQVHEPLSITALHAESITQIACGSCHSLFVSHKGRSFACGWNAYGQCGDGTTKDIFGPKEIQLPNNASVESAQCGGSHTILQTKSKCWYLCGYNGENQCLQYTQKNVLTPTLFSMPQRWRGKQVRLVAGFYETRAIISPMAHPLKWNMYDVAEWISTLNDGKYKRYAAKFIDKECDGEDLQYVTKEKLENKYKVGKEAHIVNIMAAIQKLFHPAPQTTNKAAAIKTPPKSAAKHAILTHEDDEKEEKQQSEIAQFLSKLHLSPFIHKFESEGFTKVEHLQNITKFQFEELGIRMKQRNDIKDAVEAYLNKTSYNHELQQPLKYARDPLVLFIGVSLYKDPEIYPTLNDVSKDESFLRDAFEQEYGYKFVSNQYENKLWSRKEVIRWIRKQRDELLIARGQFKHDAIIFCAAGHGNIHALVCSEGLKLERKDIRSQFAANVRDEFDHVPKLFIFNCCRVDDDEGFRAQSVSQAVEYSLSVVGTEGDQVYGPKLSKFVAASFKNNYDAEKDEINVYQAIKLAKRAAAHAKNGMKIRVEEFDTEIDDVVFIKKGKARGSPNAARNKNTRQSSPEKAKKESKSKFSK